MQSVPAWMYEAMAIVAFATGIVVLLWGLTLIMRAFWGKSSDAVMLALRTRASTRAAIAIILGGSLIWLGLHYGFEYHERLIALVSQPVPNTPPVAPPVPSSACNTVEARYGLIIDAGSSGSRIYIYCWRPGETNRVPWVTAALGQDGKPFYFKVPTPLSDVSCESDADNCLKDLIDYALEKIGNNSQMLAQIRLHLMATAGMRLKQRDNPERSKVTIETVDAYLKKRFKSASTVTSAIITLEEEALYGWIAVNYLMGFLKDKDGNSSPTMGILELGGASTQIAYASSDPSPQGPATLPWKWRETTYQIYGHSFGDLGQDQAFRKINAFYRTKNTSMSKERRSINPCYPKGYLKPGDYDVGEGTGNYNDCKDEIERTLLLPLGNNQRRPPHGVFLAYAGYYYINSFFSKAFQLNSFFSLAELETAGDLYCSSWKELEDRKELKPYEKYFPEYCFRAAYIAALLQTGYGFPKDTRQIIITDTLHGNEISWTLGAMVYQAGANLP
jgi:apyrase